MSKADRRRPSALKHAAYSATSLLPGESAGEFAQLHRDLISEFAPSGALEHEIVLSVAHHLWRRKNLHTFRFADLARQRTVQIQDSILQSTERPRPEAAVAFDSDFAEKWHLAGTRVRDELGDELFALMQMGDEATLECLLKELEVQERLDGMIDRCIKRLLLVRGVKSISTESPASRPMSLTGPAKMATRGS